MNIPTPQYKEIIKIVESAILSTDLALYFKYAVEIIFFLSTEIVNLLFLKVFQVNGIRSNGATFVLNSSPQIVSFKR